MNSQQQLIQQLDSAHAELVEARKIAALSEHESYKEIGNAIDCVEAAFMQLTSHDKEKTIDTTPSLDVADCCVSLEEARETIRRRERYVDTLMKWMDERRNTTEVTTLGMIQEQLRPLCSKQQTTIHRKNMG